MNNISVSAKKTNIDTPLQNNLHFARIKSYTVTVFVSILSIPIIGFGGTEVFRVTGTK